MAMKIFVATENEWPSKEKLMEMMSASQDGAESALKLLNQMTNNEGVAHLAGQLGSDAKKGLPNPVHDFKQRKETFGVSAFKERALTPYWKFVWQALQDTIILMLIAMATVELILKMSLGSKEDREDGWIEPLAIYTTVFIIVNVASTLDYRRERKFAQLSEEMKKSSKRFIVRAGESVEVTDEDIVVGDIVSLNSHMASVIPADGIYIQGANCKSDESALTGEPEPMKKNATNPFMVSGTVINSGECTMLVVAVGDNSISGKIRSKVYDDGEEEEKTPLFQKLDSMASAVGKLGMFVAFIYFAAKCVQGFAIKHKPAMELINYILHAIGILAVAIPEGLPLALTIALAYSSGQMSKENNLVKTLDSCETMGSATTICTDKTGTLTANRMTVQGAYVGQNFFAADTESVGKRVAGDSKVADTVKSLMGNSICVCTMNDSTIKGEEGKEEFKGNPTECALLKFAQNLGYNYEDVRSKTEGRSEDTRDKGVSRNFSSARKMMSWAVPRDNGYRIFVKGASEIILERATFELDGQSNPTELKDDGKQKINDDVIMTFARQAMRTIGVAYKDVENKPDDTTHETIKNADSEPAFVSETELILLGIVGIEDPLRDEVPGAICRCYRAGIDVRMVTGDNIDTAVAIAKKAGILADCHFNGDKPKKNRAMLGKDFREKVYLQDSEGVSHFQQDKFDEIWPYLRVLARSSPDDKLTLAFGLNRSKLFENKEKCKELKRDDAIEIFPDQQVVAMTGDGTNDAQALKQADVGFAMNIAGTQIAKDAANIILLDDNFASIVTAANWGRNVLDSIQKFLQFQLTVNVAILVIMLIVAFAPDIEDPPLSVLQMLWLNLIMDSLASLALASEPPSKAQLERPPVNRKSFIINEIMWYNMIGQATYQVIVIVILLFGRGSLPDCEDGTGPYSRHYTIIFNAFVLMQLFNEYNSRKLNGELNIFSGLLQNRMFIGISALTFILQILMAQFGGKVLKLHSDGLTGEQWALCIGLGFGPIIWQQVINVVRRSWDYLAPKGVLTLCGKKRPIQHSISRGSSMSLPRSTSSKPGTKSAWD